MRSYEHDTYYYGSDILSEINRAVGHRPDIDRGGVYIWSVARKMSPFPLMIYYDMSDNDYRGSLEVHQSGQYKRGIRGGSVLDLNDNHTDCMYNDSKLKDFLTDCLWEDTSLI